MIIPIYNAMEYLPISLEKVLNQTYHNIEILLVDNNSKDGSYDYIKVYYTRSTSDVDSNRVVTAHEIDRKFPVRNNSCNVIITGSEETKDIPVSDINIQYSIIDKAKSQTVCQNILFLGNSCKPDMKYKDLSDISLRLLPY